MWSAVCSVALCPSTCRRRRGWTDSSMSTPPWMFTLSGGGLNVHLAMCVGCVYSVFFTIAVIHIPAGHLMHF